MNKHQRYYQKNKKKLQDYSRNYRINNREKVLESRKSAYFLNREKELLRMKEFKKKNHIKLNKQRKLYRLKNKEKIKIDNQKYRDRKRNLRLKKMFNITLEDYNLLRERQNFMCKICAKNEIELGKSLFIDHSHKTGKIRGLLCHKCNIVLGMSDDDSDTLQNAIKYLHETN